MITQYLITQYSGLLVESFGCGDDFEPSCFNPIENRAFVKPRGGLWYSPVGCSYGWKQWVAENEFGDLSSRFELLLSGSIAVIDSLADLRSMPMQPDADVGCFAAIDFIALAQSGIQALHLTENGEAATRFTDPGLYGWDCESIIIMDQSAIHCPKEVSCHG